MIVRLSGDAQYEVDDHFAALLNELDDRIESAVETNDRRGLRECLRELHEMVRTRGKRVSDDDLRASDAIIPAADSSIEEIEGILSEDGLIPD